MVLQAFEHMARPLTIPSRFNRQSTDICLAPSHFKFLQKCSQLLSLYSDGGVLIDLLRVQICVGKAPFIAEALSRRCKQLGRKISRDELYAAQILDGVELVVGEYLTPLQFQLFGMS